MKRIVEVSKDESGFMSLIGEKVTLFCCRYFYTGTLVGVNDTCIELSDAKIIYETGDFDKKEWSNCQSLPNSTLFIQTGAIESYGIMK